ncbi:MAG: hypothetical protein GY801_12610, partial [bacterium]|nr:hypothetical protein [bacterium]
SFHETLSHLSRKQRSELGKLFAGSSDSDDAQTMLTMHPKHGHSRRWWPLMRFAFVNLAIILLLAAVHAVGVWIFLPDKQQIDEIAQHVQLHVSKNAEGTLTFRSVINDVYASAEQIAPSVKEALVQREDLRFYSHWGFDLRGKMRAVAKSAVYLATLKQVGRLQGGSTLTEQLAKNLFFSGARGLFSGLRRKFKERVLAYKLELYFNKDEILEMYLNRVYFGRGAYGIESAVRLFFDTPPEELPGIDEYQAALLIQSLPAPSAYNCARNPERAARESRKLLEKMETPVDDKRLADTIAQCSQYGTRTLHPPEHSYLRDWILPQIAASDYEKHLQGEFVVVTTMNARMQWFAQNAIDELMTRYVERGIFREASLPQIALVALTPNGAIQVIVGSRDYKESQFSRVTQAKRQPGSTFKLFVYLAALEQGWTPEDTISDRPDRKGWPRNAGHGHSPLPVMLIDAFKESRNASAVNLLKQLGQNSVKAAGVVKETARRLGIESDFLPEPGAALAMGVNEMTPLQMTAAYTVMGNGGFAVQPYGIIGVRTKGGTIRHWRAQKPQTRLVEKNIVHKMNRMLVAVVQEGTGRRAQFGEHIVGGKTGTTQGNSDGWFLGCSAYLCAGVWVGYDRSAQSMPRSVHGGSLPAEIFHNFMDKTHNAMLWTPQALP